jgi:hypothetical protein
MSLRHVAYAVAAVFLIAANALAQETLPIPVFVTHLEAPPPPPLKPEQHLAAISNTRDEMFAVAAKLRKEHGDQTKQWPPEVWKIFNDAADVHWMAVARRDYEQPQTRLSLDDSVADFVRGAGGNRGMTLLQSADEAALVVQITGRRYAPGSDVYENAYFIRFRIAPGAKMSSERFIELTRDYNWTDGYTRTFSRPKDGAMYVDLEAGTPVSYRNGAGTVRAIVERFIRARMDPAKKK